MLRNGLLMARINVMSYCMLVIFVAISLDAYGRIVNVNGREIEIYDGLLGVPQHIKDLPPIEDTKINEDKPIKLLCIKGGDEFTFSSDKWSGLSASDRESYQKIGIVVYTKFENILIDISDSGFFKKKQFRKFKSNEWQQIPNANQIQIIIDNLEQIQKALEEFGGEKLYTYADYWYKEEYDGKAFPSTTNFSWRIVCESNIIADPGRVRLVRSLK